MSEVVEETFELRIRKIVALLRTFRQWEIRELEEATRNWIYNPPLNWYWQVRVYWSIVQTFFWYRFTELDGDEQQVYFIRSPGTGIKIGISSDVDKRLKTLETGSPVKLELIGTTPGGPHMERFCHYIFAKHHLRGEWFDERILPSVLEVLAIDTDGVYVQ